MNAEREHLESLCREQQASRGCKIQRGGKKKKKHLPEVIPVALRCWHEENVLAMCVFIGGDKEMETKRRTAGDERHGKTLALSMHRGTIRLYGYTVNSGEPRGLSANKVIHLLIGMMEQK